MLKFIKHPFAKGYNHIHLYQWYGSLSNPLSKILIYMNDSYKVLQLLILKWFHNFEGEKNHKKGGLNCVFGNFFFYVLDNCPQVQSLK